MRSFLLHQLSSESLPRLTGRNCCFMGCFFHDLSKTTSSIVLSLQSSCFSRLVGRLVVWVSWHINLQRLINARFCLYIYLTEDFKANTLCITFKISRTFVCTRLNGFNSSYFGVQPSLSQERLNVIYFDFLEQIARTIHLENRFLIRAKSLHFMLLQGIL